MDKKGKNLIFFLFALAVGAINGLFGGGGGMLCVPIFKKFLTLDDRSAHATSVLSTMLISLPTLIVYLITLPFSVSVSLLVTFGSVLGGFVGAKLLGLFSNKTLNFLFIVVLVASGIKLLI